MFKFVVLGLLVFAVHQYDAISFNMQDAAEIADLAELLAQKIDMNQFDNDEKTNQKTLEDLVGETKDELDKMLDFIQEKLANDYLGDEARQAIANSEDANVMDEVAEMDNRMNSLENELKDALASIDDILNRIAGLQNIPDAGEDRVLFISLLIVRIKIIIREVRILRIVIITIRRRVDIYIQVITEIINIEICVPFTNQDGSAGCLKITLTLESQTILVDITIFIEREVTVIEFITERVTVLDIEIVRLWTIQTEINDVIRQSGGRIQNGSVIIRGEALTQVTTTVVYISTVLYRFRVFWDVEEVVVEETEVNVTFVSITTIFNIKCECPNTTSKRIICVPVTGHP